MDKRIKKIIIGLFLILLILIVVILIILQSKKTEKNTTTRDLSYINSEEWNDEIHPDGMPRLISVYRGKLMAKNMGKSMYYFATDVIPKYYSKLKDEDDSKISSYYKDNSKLISEETGINNEQDFKELIDSIQTLKSDELTFHSFRIDKDSIEPSSKYTEAVLYITYQENSEIGFSVKIDSTQQKDVSSLVYTALKKE